MSKTTTRFDIGVVLTPTDITTNDMDFDGQVGVDSTDDKLKVQLNGTIESVVTEEGTASLENKTIDADLNTILDLEVDNLKSGVLNTSASLAGATDLQVPSALAAKSYADSLIGSVTDDVANLVTLSGVPVDSVDLGTFTGGVIPANQNNKQAMQALASKAVTTDAVVNAIGNATNSLITLSGLPSGTNDLGTFTGTIIPDASTVKPALQSLETSLEAVVTSDATKVTGPASATDNAIARFDLTTGKVIQDSLVTISDTGAIAGATGLTSSGTISSTGTLAANGNITEAITSDGTATGANATISNPATSFLRLTNASLTSVDMISAPVSGEVLTIENATGNPITINNNTGGTAANRILTGTKAALTLADEASIILKYDATEQRWMTIGGTGSGSAGLSQVFQLTGTDASTWSTGNNAAVLGGGSLAGTFVSNTTNPLQGSADYKYTQAAGSLNDYFLSSVQTVDPRFRGQQVTTYFPFTYDGASNDIRVVFYCITTGAEIPSSVYIQASTTVSMFKTNITIPSNCAGIRFGFQTAVANSGKILTFDSVQMSSDTTIFADVANKIQTAFISTAAVFTNTVITGALSSSSGDGVFTYNTGTGIYTLVRPATIYMSYSASANAATTVQLLLNAAGAQVGYANSLANIGSCTSVSHSLLYPAGTQFSFQVANAGKDHRISFVAVASNQSIVTSPDVFSTETTPLVYANAATFTLATLANANPGTYITFTYATSTNTRTQTTGANRPTQTDADMSLNGIQLFTRAFNAASTSASPAVAAIQVGKGMKGLTTSLYKSSGKVNAGWFDTNQYSSTAKTGLGIYSYNENTGILIIDAGYQEASTTTSSTLIFGDTSTQTNGFFVINASKNPALVGLNTNLVYSESAGNAGQVITVDVTNISFIGVSDTHGAWNGTQYTVPESGVYNISIVTNWTTSAARVLAVYKNGVAFRNISVSPSTGLASGQLSQRFTKGEVISFRAAGSAGTLLNSAIGHNLSITKTSVG